MTRALPAHSAHEGGGGPGQPAKAPRGEELGVA
jgi:hypothetical protein